jgi:hypothetical protein
MKEAGGARWIVDPRYWQHWGKGLAAVQCQLQRQVGGRFTRGLWWMLRFRGGSKTPAVAMPPWPGPSCARSRFVDVRLDLRQLARDLVDQVVRQLVGEVRGACVVQVPVRIRGLTGWRWGKAGEWMKGTVRLQQP